MTRSVLLAALLGLVCACGAEGNGTCATTDVPTACPASGSPSYSKDVAPILSAQCNGCHGFSSYASASSSKSSIQSRVANCNMPQGGALSAAERSTLLGWTVCGAPNN